MKDFIENITTGDGPAGGMGVVAVVLLLLAFRIFKGVRRVVFIVLAVAFLAGAVWWHFHVRGR